MAGLAACGLASEGVANGMWLVRLDAMGRAARLMVGLGRWVVQIGCVVLLGCSGYLWCLRPNPATCFAVPIARYSDGSTRDYLVVVWDTGQITRLHRTNAVFWLKGQPFVAHLRYPGLPTMMTAVDGRVAKRLSSSPDRLSVVAIDPTDDSLLVMDHTTAATPSLYRVQADGTQSQRLWTYWKTPSMVWITSDASAVIIKMQGFPSHTLVINTRANTVSRVATTPLIMDGVIAWHTQRHELIYLQSWEEGFYRVRWDGTHRQRVNLPHTPINVWSGNESGPTLLYSVAQENYATLYALDWDATEPRKLRSVGLLDFLIGFIDDTYALIYQWQMQTIARLDTPTGAVLPYDYSIKYGSNWGKDDAYLWFVTDEKPPQLMSMSLAENHAIRFATLPDDFRSPTASPCRDQFWYERSNGDLVRLDVPSGHRTTWGNMAHSIDIFAWVRINLLHHWHPRALLAAGVGLLLGVGLLPFIRRRRRG